MIQAFPSKPSCVWGALYATQRDQGRLQPQKQLPYILRQGNVPFLFARLCRLIPCNSAPHTTPDMIISSRICSDLEEYREPGCGSYPSGVRSFWPQTISATRSATHYTAIIGHRPKPNRDHSLCQIGHAPQSIRPNSQETNDCVRFNVPLNTL